MKTSKVLNKKYKNNIYQIIKDGVNFIQQFDFDNETKFSLKLCLQAFRQLSLEGQINSFIASQIKKRSERFVLLTGEEIIAINNCIEVIDEVKKLT